MKIFSLLNKDAKILYDTMKELQIPEDQLYLYDDEICPCGSGKAYKDCCKGKSDDGPVNSKKPVEVLLMKEMRNGFKQDKVCLHSDQSNCKLPPNLKLPLRDGDIDRQDDENYQEHFFLNATSKDAPQVVDRHVQPVVNPMMVYSGCFCNVSVNFYPFNANGSRGVAVGLGKQPHNL